MVLGAWLDLGKGLPGALQASEFAWKASEERKALPLSLSPSPTLTPPPGPKGDTDNTKLLSMHNQHSPESMKTC